MDLRKALAIFVLAVLVFVSGVVLSTAYDASTEPETEPDDEVDASVILLEPYPRAIFEPDSGEEASVDFEFEVDSEDDGEVIFSIDGEEEESFDHSAGEELYELSDDFGEGVYVWRVVFRDEGEVIASAARFFSVLELPEDSRHCYYQSGGDFVDADGDGLAGYDGDQPEDPGCVLPLWRDEVEGLAWEPHLGSTMEGESNSIERPEPYFSGSFVEMGNDLESNREEDSVTGNGTSIQYISYYIGDEGSESGEDWGFGERRGMMITGFPSGSVVVDDRVVLPPNPASDYTGGDTCGDGIENQDGDLPEGSQGDESGTAGSPDYCREDYGRIYDKESIETPMEGDCRDDEASCSSDAEVSCMDGSTGGDDHYCYSDDCGVEEEADCSIDEDYSGDEGNEEFRAVGDVIEVRECANDGACFSFWEDNCVAADGDSCESEDAGGTWYADTCWESNSDPCEAETWDGAGEERSWNGWSIEQDCNAYNTVDGGTSSPGSYENSQAGTYTEFTAYDDINWGANGVAWCGYDYTTTVNADGSWGLGNGFAVIYDGDIVATENPEGNDEVGQHIYVDGSSTSYDFSDMIDTSCGSDRKACIKYANFYTESSGWSTSSNPLESEIRDAVSVDVQTMTADESYSVCKNINRINEENGDGRSLIDCDYMQGTFSIDNVSPLPQACGDEENEQLMVMEGPQVDQGSVEQHLFHEQKCVSWGSGETDRFDRELDENACVNKGEAFAEGTVANVAFSGDIVDVLPENYEGYEEGGDSPDWQVCLNIADSPFADMGDVTSKPYNHLYNDRNEEAFGGQWYDLDDPVVNEYLRHGDHDIDLSEDQRASTSSSENIHHIDYYYSRNPMPYHEDYNPEGLNESDPDSGWGTSLLASCGPLLEGCGDDGDRVRGGVAGADGTFFAFFEESAVDVDYHPQGRIDNFWHPVDPGMDPLFDPPGMVNMIKSYQDTGNSRYPGQLSPGHYEYDNWDLDWWEDTRIDEDNAIQFAYTRDSSWVIDSTGVPYPAWGEEIGYDSEMAQDGNIQENFEDSSAGIHYNLDHIGDVRGSPSDDTVTKNSRAMGNSMAVVAAREIRDDEDNWIHQGEAFWIDPDDIRYHADEGNIQGIRPETNDWRNLVQYEIDITGPDSGLGWDWSHDDYYNSSLDPEIDPDIIETDLNYGSEVIYTDIRWEKDDEGDIVEGLEPPMCGDDRWEYLLEEMGASGNSEKYQGGYACATSQDYCVSYEGDDDQVLYEHGEYVNTNGPGEAEGRLKQDKEVCLQRPQDDVSMWWDQDYAEEVEGVELCRENTLFGSQGKRWIDYDYINEHPFAVNGGIDDSWNDRLEQMGHASLESDPEGENWDENPLDQGYSPVPTGTDDDLVADPYPNYGEYGFCAGDDASEYLIMQDSQTRFLDTRDEVVGVAMSPDSCVLENSDLDNTDEERRLYQEGDTVEFQSEDTQREIGCFAGQWWDEWPVQFLEDNVEVGLSDTDRTTFRIINPRETGRTFDLTLSTSNEDCEGEGNDCIERGMSFTGTGTDEMTVTVPGGSSNTYDLEIAGLEQGDGEIQLRAESQRGDLDGTDTIGVEIVEGYVSETEGEVRGVSGLTTVYMAVIFLLGLAYFIYRS